MYKFDHYLEYMFAGYRLGSNTTETEGVSPLHGVVVLQEMFPGVCIDYSDAKSVAADGSIPEPAGVICFPLHPKPHHIRDVDWVVRYWDTAPPSPPTLVK